MGGSSFAGSPGKAAAGERGSGALQDDEFVASPASCELPALTAHKGTTVEEVNALAKWNPHLSDFVAAISIRHDAATKQAPTAAGEGLPRSTYVSRSQRKPSYGPFGVGGVRVGGVRVVQVDDNLNVI